MHTTFRSLSASQFCNILLKEEFVLNFVVSSFFSLCLDSFVFECEWAEYLLMCVISHNVA